jgi:hypothetical protein
LVDGVPSSTFPDPNRYKSDLNVKPESDPLIINKTEKISGKMPPTGKITSNQDKSRSTNSNKAPDLEKILIRLNKSKPVN